MTFKTNFSINASHNNSPEEKYGWSELYFDDLEKQRNLNSIYFPKEILIYGLLESLLIKIKKHARNHEKSQVFQNYKQKPHKVFFFSGIALKTEGQVNNIYIGFLRVLGSEKAATLTLIHEGFMLQFWDFHLSGILIQHGNLSLVLWPLILPPVSTLWNVAFHAG